MDHDCLRQGIYMNSIQEIITFPGKKAQECYETTLRTFPTVGFQIWKKRDLGWFAIALRQVNGADVNVNVMFRQGQEATLTLGVSAEHLSEAELHKYADEFIGALRTNLG
jgi:hypothetical protein